MHTGAEEQEALNEKQVRSRTSIMNELNYQTLLQAKFRLVLLVPWTMPLLHIAAQVAKVQGFFLLGADTAELLKPLLY